ncbi:MAG: Gfo/Idh/MocA family oxidoreductase [Anaerolineaceae bacterium]|nr:Gfo/Idh/MocA family oxidoreductase [Anaerolineaceae bacterium]
MTDLHFAVLGTGFWSHYQIPAWFEVGGVKITALYNRTVSKAVKVAEKYALNDARVYGDPEELLRKEKLDFIDIITEIEGHSPLVHLAAKYKVPVICQKPMAPDLATAEQMVMACRDAGVPFFIHENFRWQTPIRALKKVLDEGKIGKPFRATITFASGYPVFANQPFLKTIDHFIVSDLGSHTLDVARFLFGEASLLFCQTRKVHGDIKGEDVATILLETENNVTVVIKMAYAENYLEKDPFPQTMFFIEGERGSIELDMNYWLRVTTSEGTQAQRVPPPRYLWADPEYDVVHSSIVPCNANILRGLKGEGMAETTGEDNLRTVRLVFACYQSAASGQSIQILPNE